MTSEDQEMLDRISRIAAQINRHKNQQLGLTPAPAPAPYSSGYRPHAAATYHPYKRSYAPRGGYRGKPAAYRNRTLVLNGSSMADKSANGTDQPKDADAPSTAAKGTWVSKTDRHMQLINSSVYEKEAPARSKAIEQTRLQKQKLKDDRERAKLRNHLRYLANSSDGAGGSGNANGRAPAPYQVVIDGIPFHVVKNGSKLVKAPGDPNPPSSTPKTAIVGGVKFFRSKNGNMYRHGVVRAQRRSGTVKKIDQPCKIFSTTGIPPSLLAHPAELAVLSGAHRSVSGAVGHRPLVSFANHRRGVRVAAAVHTGSCTKGPRCRYIHDPAKVAVCKEFLLKGHCASGQDCDLSHDLTPERTPICLHYAKGNCTNPQCPYTHSEVSTGAPVCRSFAIYGYCDKGADCTERHVFECPDFSNTGVCKTKGCKLPHRERASFMRRASNNHGERTADAEDADLVDASSDESVHSDDVDSDEVDEFVGADGDDADLDFVNQKDFIEF